MENNMFNGRVNLISKSSPSFDYCDSSFETTPGHDIVSRSLEHTPVSALFFSALNIDALQKGITNSIYNKSQGRFNIGRQSDMELKIIMRSFYFESLKNGSPNILHTIMTGDYTSGTDDTLEQVRKLNKTVLDWVVPRIMTNIQQFEKYKQDVSTLPKPMDRPSFLSMSGTKSLELQPFM